MVDHQDPAPPPPSLDRGKHPRRARAQNNDIHLFHSPSYAAKHAPDNHTKIFAKCPLHPPEPFAKYRRSWGVAKR
ncbi:hypothetical protein GCM10010873_01270 [Cypionkella aquatica]|uniref:Uncharacterized protein n=1 Tax=Cypionkella aquatica TaxID=1756042 RepID=A0AA37TNQ4_9RHOB|nr:hypothetical protein GCM10010873_01270 [Cypionkella aquatica]